MTAHTRGLAGAGATRCNRRSHLAGRLERSLQQVDEAAHRLVQLHRTTKLLERSRSRAPRLFASALLSSTLGLEIVGEHVTARMRWAASSHSQDVLPASLTRASRVG